MTFFAFVRYVLAAVTCVLVGQILGLVLQMFIPFNEFMRGAISVLFVLGMFEALDVQAPWRQPRYVASLEEYESEGERGCWKGPLA